MKKKNHLAGAAIPLRTLCCISLLAASAASLSFCGEAAAESWIWWPAADSAAVFAGQMTKSSAYTAGADADTAADSLMPALVYANSTTNALGGGSADTVTYWVTLPESSYWSLWGRFYFPGAPGSNDANSFLVSVDGGGRQVFGNNKNYFRKWHWGGNGANELGPLAPVSLGFLAAGSHRIVVEKREVTPIAPRLDALLLTSAPTYVPLDTEASEALGVAVEPPAPKLSASPAALTYPSTPVGTTAAAQSVQLNNTGAATLSVTSVTISGANAADFTTTASATYNIQPGASASFNVTFAPKAAGTRTAQINIASNGGNATLSITGTATATPVLSVSPGTLTYPSSVVGAAAAAQAIQLNNTGTATLSVTSVTLGGTNAADFTTTASATYSIQPGASASFSVTFAPKAAGTRTAQISIASNGGSATVSITGTATAAPAPTNDIYLSAALAPAKFKGTMTSSTAYAGGSDLDAQLDALCSKLVYANSKTDSWYTMSGDEVAYVVNFPKAGNWYLWGRFYYPGRPGTNDANSFAVSVDSGTWFTFGNKKDQFQRFHWDGNGALEGGALQPLNLGSLTAGNHTLHIRKREVTPIPPRLDVLMLTQTAAKVPTDAEARTALGIPMPVLAPSISVAPTALTFGTVEVGASSLPQTVTVSNTGTAVLNISAVTITGVRAGCFSSTAAQTYAVPAGGKVAFTVTFCPKIGGAAVAAIEITSNAPSAKASLTLSGEATVPTTPPALQLDKSSVDFGTIAAGTTSPAITVNLTNSGGSALTIGSISLTGAQPAHFAYTAPALPMVLAAGANASLDVFYTPVTPGSTCSASLVIASTDPAGNKSVALSGACQAAPTGDYANDGSVAGTNLTGLADYSSEWPFADCFKMSRAFWSGTEYTWNDSRALDLDSNGWPKSLQSGQWAKTLIFWDLPNKYPSGDYVVLYDGEGTLVYQHAATKISSAPGRDVIRADASKGGFGVSIAATNPSNYIRNIRVIMPGLESTYQTQMFHPTFIESIKYYKVIRFMDWMNTNGSEQVNWTDRPKPTDAQWTRKGAPLEVICALANTLHADAWVCVPHKATDDYVRQMATLLKTQLEPDLAAWVEHSNEVWNWGFPQTAYASERGMALGLNSNQYEAVYIYHSYRTLQVVTIFEEVFGDLSRLVRVMGAQAAGSWWAEQMLKYNNAYTHIDALAIAPYFGGYLGSSGQLSRVTGMTVDSLINELRTQALPEAYGWIDASATVANRYNVALVAYEGGQHLVGVGAPMENATLNTLFDAVNRDPRMGDLYTEYLNYWKSKGGDIFVHFNNAMIFCKYGRWGSMEYLGQPRAETPKYDALQRYVEANRFK